MPVTVTLSTLPGHLVRERGYTAKTIELFGPSLGTETLAAISTVADIKAAVARFGARLRLQHPDASFFVSVRLAKGCRKPNGFEAASNRNGFGQDDFLRVETGRGIEPAGGTDEAASPTPPP